MAVVPLSENDEHVPRRRWVVEHLDQAGETAVHEGGIADHADHLARLLGGQGVAQTQAHTDGCAHAHASVHGREGRQHAQGVTTDVARHDAAEVAQGLEDVAVRTTGAQFGRACPRAARARAGVASDNPAHARHIEFAKAEALGLVLDLDAGDARRLEEAWVAFLDDQTAIDAGGEPLHGRDGQGVGQSQLEHARLRQRLAHVLEGNTRGDHAQGSSSLDDDGGSVLLVPRRDLGQLGAQPAVGRAGVGGNHHAAGNVAHESGGRRWCRRGTRRKHGSRVAHARGQAQEHGNMPALGDLDANWVKS